MGDDRNRSTQTHHQAKSKTVIYLVSFNDVEYSAGNAFSPMKAGNCRKSIPNTGKINESQIYLTEIKKYQTKWWMFEI